MDNLPGVILKSPMGHSTPPRVLWSLTYLKVIRDGENALTLGQHWIIAKLGFQSNSIGLFGTCKNVNTPYIFLLDLIW